jgi:glycolate oxidase FAD binding subunit
VGVIAPPAPALRAFADEVGPSDPVVCAGGRTAWAVGGPPDPSAREVRAPSGIVQVLPAEMIVRVRAGTTVAELDDALGEVSQEVALPAEPGATVGGVLAVGRSGLHQLGLGPARDAVLELTWVTAEGDVARNGGPVVKNVSGFDLCRLLVGSLGTLGLVAEVVLRTRPVPDAGAWLSGPTDPAAVLAGLHAPTAVLWDGRSTWVRVEGLAADVAEQQRRGSALGLVEVEGPPQLPAHRWSVGRDVLADRAGDAGPFVALVGVGVVFSQRPGPAPRIGRTAADLGRMVKARFDPTGRLNPGRDVLVGVEVVDDAEVLL